MYHIIVSRIYKPKEADSIITRIIWKVFDRKYSEFDTTVFVGMKLNLVQKCRLGVT